MLFSYTVATYLYHATQPFRTKRKMMHLLIKLFFAVEIILKTVIAMVSIIGQIHVKNK